MQLLPCKLQHAQHTQDECFIRCIIQWSYLKNDCSTISTIVLHSISMRKPLEATLKVFSMSRYLLQLFSDISHVSSLNDWSIVLQKRASRQLEMENVYIWRNFPPYSAKCGPGVRERAKKVGNEGLMVEEDWREGEIVQKESSQANFLN